MDVIRYPTVVDLWKCRAILGVSITGAAEAYVLIVDRQLVTADNTTLNTHTLIVMIPVTDITIHFFHAGQFCGFFGSLGPSHETGFTSTGS